MDVVELVKRHEGLRLKPYTDTVGKLTIGYGRNLTDKGISAAEAVGLLEVDLSEAVTQLEPLPFWAALGEVRQAVLVDMTINLGLRGLMGFHHMLDALSAGNFELAADHLRNSKAAAELPARYADLYVMMRLGRWPGQGA